MKVNEVLRILKRAPLNYTIARKKGSHRTMYSDAGFGRVMLSAHEGHEMSKTHVKQLFVDQVGLSVEEALELLARGRRAR